MTKTKKIVVIGIFAAISSVLMYLEFPLPFFPPFLKIDLSNIPILIITFMFGPFVGVATAAIKDVIHLFVSQTAGVGELADFIITSVFIVTAYFIYKSIKGKKGAVIGCFVAIFTMAVAGALANKFIILPFYMNIMPLKVIIDISSSVIPSIKDINSLILFGIVPFNLFKGFIISIVTILVYKKLESFIKKNSLISK